MKKILIIFILAIFLAVVLSFYYYKQSATKKTKTIAGKKISVAASFYPLAYFAEQIGGDFVETTNITPLGAEPHDYEPTPKEIIKIKTSSIFIFNGGNLDPWAKKLAQDKDDQNIIFLDMSGHFPQTSNPHFWLDPLLAKKEAELIDGALIKIDPQHTKQYADNTAKLIGKLNDLDIKYRQGLAECRLRDIIVSHDAFGHLADRYRLNVFPISGLSPDEEPSPQQLGKIVKIVKEKNIQIIFAEPLLNKKLAQTIAGETGVGILTLNPIEGLTEDEKRLNKDYFSLMEENLINLRQALSCK